MIRPGARPALRTLLLGLALLAPPAAPVLKAQPPDRTPFEVALPPAQSLVTMQDVFRQPVWCGPGLAAFPRGEVRDGVAQYWIEYYRLADGTVTRQPPTDGEGSLVACNVGGSERLTVAPLSDFADFGAFRLSIPGRGETVALIDDAMFVAADETLRTLVFNRERPLAPLSLRHTYELVLVEPSAASPEARPGPPRETVLLGPRDTRADTPAAVSPDGAAVVYVRGSPGEADRGADPARGELVVANRRDGSVACWRLNRILPGAAVVEHLVYGRHGLLVIGSAASGELLVARCHTPLAGPPCETRNIGLDSRLFEVLGATADRLVVGSRVGKVGSDGLVACLLVAAAEDLKEAAAGACYRPEPLPTVYFGLAPDRLYGLSPDGRTVLVQTTFRNRAPGDPSIESAWSIAPLSSFRR